MEYSRSYGLLETFTLLALALLDLMSPKATDKVKPSIDTIKG